MFARDDTNNKCAHRARVSSLVENPRARCAPYERLLTALSFPRRRESMGHVSKRRACKFRGRLSRTRQIDSRLRGNDRVAYRVALGQYYNRDGMASLTLGMPVTAASMRFVGHALPRTKRHAAPGDTKKYKAKINYAGLLVPRCDEWNRVAFVATVNPKISAIHGDDTVF